MKHACCHDTLESFVRAGTASSACQSHSSSQVESMSKDTTVLAQSSVVAVNAMNQTQSAIMHTPVLLIMYSAGSQGWHVSPACMPAVTV